MTVLCGAEEITGAGFHRGLSGLLGLYDDPQLHSLVEPMISLLGDASVLRLKQYPVGEPFRLDICPLYQLIDMFRLREATDRRDKVYALLGIATQNPTRSEIVPDYATEWADVFRNLVKSILGSKVKADWAVQNGQGYGRLSGKGFTLGHIRMVESEKGELPIVVMERASRSHPTGRYGRPRTDWVLHNSTTAVQKGDVVCCLEGSTAATIIRPQGNHFMIVVVYARLPRDFAHIVFRKKHSSDTDPVAPIPFQYSRHFHLIWAFDLEWTASRLQIAHQSQEDSERILRLSSMARSLEDVDDRDGIAELIKYAAELLHHTQSLPVEAVEHFQHLSRAIPNWALYLQLKQLLQRVLYRGRSAVDLLNDVELDIVEFQLRLRASTEHGTALLKLLLDYEDQSFPRVQMDKVQMDKDYGPMLAFLFDVWGPVLGPLSILDFIRYVELVRPNEKGPFGYHDNIPTMEVMDVLMRATTEHPVWGKSMLEHLFGFAKGDVDRIHGILRALVVCSTAAPWWKQAVVECILTTHQGHFVPDFGGPEKCYTAALEFLWDFYIVPAKDFVAITASGTFQQRRQLLETFISDYQFWKACYDGRTDLIQTGAVVAVDPNTLHLCKDIRGRWCRVSGHKAAEMNGHFTCVEALFSRGILVIGGHEQRGGTFANVCTSRDQSWNS